MYLNEVRNIHLLKVIVAQLLLRSKSVLLEKLKGWVRNCALGADGNRMIMHDDGW